MFISRLLQPKVLLVLICAFFLFTRLFKITEIPSSVYWDEASIGYNAYSIAQTGQDEWGKFLPLHFRAFGEFKLPVYIYATVPAVMIFGLNAFSVRLPAVLFSLGVVILTYFLARKLSGSPTAGLLSSFFISISPWFFIFSRTGYEATAGLMFYLLGLHLFLSMKGKKFHLILSSLSFILSMYSYNSFRIIVPLALIILAVLHYDTLVYHNKAKILTVISVALVLLSLVPIIKLVKSDNGAIRLQTVGILSSGSKTEQVVNFTKNYLSHFSPDFLFLHGDKNLRSQQSGFGQLYLPELLLLPIGLLYVFKNKPKVGLLPLTLFLLGPIPAAITKESPHALRSISMVPFIAIICAEGVAYFGQLFKNRRNLINFTVAIIFLILFINYFQSFLNIYPAESSKDWQYEYKRIYTDYGDKFDQYDRILISDKYAQPYIFTLFYRKIDPDKFRREVVRNSIDQWGFSTVKKFGKFEFGKFPEMVSFN